MFQFGWFGISSETQTYWNKTLNKSAQQDVPVAALACMLSRLIHPTILLHSKIVQHVLCNLRATPSQKLFNFTPLFHKRKTTSFFPPLSWHLPQILHLQADTFSFYFWSLQCFRMWRTSLTGLGWDLRRPDIMCLAAERHTRPAFLPPVTSLSSWLLWVWLIVFHLSHCEAEELKDLSQ